MGVDFFIPEVQGQKTSVESMCTDYIANMESIKGALAEFIADTELKGSAYSSAKSYFSQVYLPLANGIILVCESIKSAHEKFVSQYLSDVDGNSLQSDILEEQIRAMQNTIDDLTTELSNITKNPEGFRPGLAHSIGVNQSAKQVLQEKLNKLLVFDGSSATIFSEINSALSSVQQGMAQATSGNGWDANTGTFSTTKLNMQWAKPIGTSWEKREKEKLEELDDDSKAVLKRAEEDYKAGKIDESTFDSIVSGFVATGSAFLGELLNSKVTDKMAEGIADAMVQWVQQNTTFFMDRGLVAITNTGANMVFSEAPSLLTKAIRGGAKYGGPIVGAVIDFGMQVAQGEDIGNAAVKTTGHVAIGVGAAKVGAMIGSAIPGPDTVIGAAAGFVIGVAGSMAFDWVHDNKEAIVEGIGNVANKVGDAVSGFFGGLGGVFG